MITKIGMVGVGVGVLAGLAAVAPLASANESHGDHHGHGASSHCSIAGGEATAQGRNGDAGLAGNVLTQAPVAGVDALNVVCSKVLSDNFSGNTANVALLSGDLPFELPSAPSFPGFPSF